MKTILAPGFILLLLGLVCSAGELRVATVDLPRVLAGYQKAQEVAKELKSREVSFRKELDDLRLEGRRLVAEVDGLRQLSLDPALSASEREAKQRGLESKLADLQAFGVRYDGVKSQREAELQAQAARVNKSVLDDVMTATRGVGEKDGFHLILNASKANPVGSDVLFSRGVDDVTEKVLTRLNATAVPARTPNP